MEVIGKITHENESNMQLFKLLFDALTAINTGSNLKDLRLKFVYELLIVTGYWPYGKRMENPDKLLEEAIERQLSTPRVGKRLLS